MIFSLFASNCILNLFKPKDLKQNINLHVLNDFLDSNNVFEEECRVELYLNKHFKLKLLIIYF